MKICIISSLYEPYLLGGVEVYVRDISKELTERGYEVIIITTKPYEGIASLSPSVEIKDKIKIYRFYPFNIKFRGNINQENKFIGPFWSILDFWNIHTYFVIKKILKEEKPDIVHTHNLVGLSLSVFNAVKNSNIFLIHRIHDYALLCPRGTLLKGSGRICNKPNLLCNILTKLRGIIINHSSPDIVTSASKFTLDMFLKNSFFKNSKKIVLPRPIKTASIEYKKCNQYCSKNNFNILFVGQLARNKGIDILINAFKKISNKNIRLHIVGSGPCKNKLKELALDDKRIIFHGKVVNEKVHYFYNCSDVTVVPSLWYEVFGGVITESFLEGTPVVGSNIGGISEVIKEGYNGFLFEAGNVKQLKEILEYIIENPKKLKELSKNAMESVKKYEMSKHIEKLIEIYKEAIEIK